MTEVSRRGRPRAAGSRPGGGIAKTDVLIVSRDYDTRTIFAAALRSAGYVVRELEDPDQVVAAARGCAIVITDFPTTTGSGKTVTSLLRADPVTRGVTILNATTHVWGDELTEASEAGVNATLVLPAFPGRLVDCVRRLLSDEGTRR
jgi:CheY-like chemotaxis protein